MPSRLQNRFLKIVTVEDSPAVAQRLVPYLQELEGISYLGNCTDMAEALIFIEEGKPDLVILDIQLRGNQTSHNGIALLKILRKKNPDLVIVMFTNHVTQPYRDRCFASGADYFFDKSLDMERMMMILRSIQQNLI